MRNNILNELDIIEAFIRDPELLERYYDQFVPEHFPGTKEARRIVEYVRSYYEEAKQPPSIRKVENEFDVELRSHEGRTFDVNYRDFILRNFEERIKQARFGHITDLILKKIEKNEDATELYKQIGELSSFTLDRDLGIDYLKNPKERLSKLAKKSETISSGWASLDHALSGGFMKGELNFVAGFSGAGKSIVLQNLALNFLKIGLNVVYITLELSSEYVGLRLDMIATGTPLHPKILNENKIHEICCALNLMKRELPDIRGLMIKFFPSGTKTSQIRGYIKEYMDQTKQDIDVLIVDYLDLLSPSEKGVRKDEYFTKDKYVSEEMRNMAAEFGFMCMTASQLNRSAAGMAELDETTIAGGMSKLQTSDNFFVIESRPSQIRNGRMRFRIFKNRSGAGSSTVVDMCIDPTTLRIFDDPASEIMKRIGRENGNGMKMENTEKKISNGEKYRKLLSNKKVTLKENRTTPPETKIEPFSREACIGRDNPPINIDSILGRNKKKIKITDAISEFSKKEKEI